MWLANNGFALSVATRLISGESEPEIPARLRRAVRANWGSAIDSDDPLALTVFPEMDEAADVPEITESCWAILGKSPADVMCASSRMVVRFKGAARPTVIACTLLPYDPRFDLGPSLAGALGSCRSTTRIARNSASSAAARAAAAEPGLRTVKRGRRYPRSGRRF